MRQMKFWKIAFTMLVVTLFIASCRNDEHKPTFLTREQQETYARNISGTYPAGCCVLYVNKDSKRGFDEQGNPIVYGGKEVIEDVQFHVYNYNMIFTYITNFESKKDLDYLNNLRKMFEKTG